MLEHIQILEQYEIIWKIAYHAHNDYRFKHREH